MTAKPKIKASFRGTDSLIREIHHRVINQLNLVYNILYFQRQFNRDGRCAALLEGNQKRIKAIALVYEHIDRALDFDRVHFAGYCKSLLAEVMVAASNPRKKVSLKTRIAAVSVDVTTAVTCGLIINELLDNALKHAFPGDRRAEIFFGLQERKDGGLAVTVSDNGIGLPPEVQWRRGGSMGSFLVNTLSENLKGELTVDVNNGTTFQLYFRPSPEPGQ
ncbi:MAG TPA: histidine kinase dimerization/phosphoacceptor domain -containing protein [Acidobacteriota bacterium]